MAKIDYNVAMVKMNAKIIKEFKEDDMYVNCHNNYKKVMEQIFDFRNMIDHEFRPQIRTINIEKGRFVDLDKLAELNATIDGIKAQIEQ